MTNRRVWTEKKIEQAKYLLKDHTYLEASELLNVTFHSLKNAAEHHRFTKYTGSRREYRKWRGSDYKRMSYLVKQGDDWQQIADYFSTGIFSAKAFYYRHTPSKRKPYKRIAHNIKSEISKLKKEGLTYEAIGIKVGKTKNAICGAVWRHKL